MVLPDPSPTSNYYKINKHNIYRGLQPVNWAPQQQFDYLYTTVAILQLINRVHHFIWPEKFNVGSIF